MDAASYTDAIEEMRYLQSGIYQVFIPQVKVSDNGSWQDLAGHVISQWQEIQILWGHPLNVK